MDVWRLSSAPARDDNDRMVKRRVRPSEIDLRGVTASGARQTIALPAVRGGYEKPTGDSVVLPAEALRDHGRDVGDQARLRWGNGDVSTMRVVGS
ncbi:hypothetical protein [Streptomyces tsukubensis]|uniref:Uncharacterized protein n=1 Tax=Streptomyces tsukubensis TaxID=83656 RepID=A0A1V4A9A7_9ACTN|nr:hypothetical protein [Streptomyces tsukubensis]OON79649.1 hypothetical protein B1H18_13850 [Streptomyces tsukubensis]QFR95835.1 hypothetical protein GBW32_25875 [Streptomyces tsukubensis]